MNFLFRKFSERVNTFNQDVKKLILYPTTVYFEALFYSKKRNI